MRDFADRNNLLLLIQLRWIAVIGQVVTIYFVHFSLGIRLPLFQMTGVALFLVWLNLISHLRHRQRGDVNNGVLFLELLLDVAALTVQLYLSGGASNPFISLYLLQVILGAALLNAASVWLLVLITSACFIWLTMSYQEIALPHAHGADLFNMHIQGMFICFVLAACLLVFFMARIQQNLKARDAHLAELRQRAAEEDHIVRMGLLASGAAHELGTPLATLSVILGDWQRMAPVADDPDIQQDLTEMQAQLDRCKQIVSGILMSSGDMRGEGAERTSIVSFLDGVASQWRGSRQPREFDYNPVIDPDFPIVADTALKQALFNILDNALEASPDWLALAAGVQGDKIVITVSDNGPGFDPSFLASFGKPYQTTKTRAGAGLGLFLVVNVVRKLGGTVVARNNADGGASVTVSLPRAALVLEEQDGR